MPMDREQETFAEPSDELLKAYSYWLYMERKLLHLEMLDRWGENSEKFLFPNTGAEDFHTPPWPKRWYELPQPSTRAALVLETVGCKWNREG